jgi:hypothetical protein
MSEHHERACLKPVARAFIDDGSQDRAGRKSAGQGYDEGCCEYRKEIHAEIVLKKQEMKNKKYVERKICFIIRMYKTDMKKEGRWMQDE